MLSKLKIVINSYTDKYMNQLPKTIIISDYFIFKTLSYRNYGNDYIIRYRR